MIWRRKTLRTSKLARRRRLFFLLKSTSVFFVALALLAGFVYGLNREEILIQRVSVSGTDALKDSDLEHFVTERLAGKYFFLIPKSNILLYPKSSIKASVLGSFKRVKDIDVLFDTWTGIHIVVEERDPHALWCGENRLEGAVPNCYFLDEDGFIYAESPNFSGSVYRHLYGPLGSGDPVGQMYLDQEVYHSLTLFFTLLNEVGIEAVELAIRDEDDYELYLKSGTQMLFGRKQDLNAVLDNLQSVFLSPEFEQMPLSKIEYIDLRFGNKVYYRIRDEVKVEIEN